MSSMHKSYLREENLLTLLSQNTFIIPEIQREYVWGHNEEVIVPFLKQVKEKLGTVCQQCHAPHGYERINVGFLYSYKPDYVQLRQERFLDENLIDGQQRFTTLFLLLFFCAIKENRYQDHLNLIRFEENMSFDFRVRDLTRSFLLDLVRKTKDLESLKKVRTQTWFLKDYASDTSVSAMITAIGFIDKVFNQDSGHYYHHLLTNVVFWHFKTEATSQGEELYITMNARGESLDLNEIIKAKFLQSPYEQGKKWEEWQDFFWQHRGSNQNADKGFNEFLRWVQIIRLVEEREGKQTDRIKDSKEIEIIKSGKATPDLEHVSFEDVERYMEALKFLYNEVNKYVLINTEEALFSSEWLGSKGTLAQIDLFKLLPSLVYAQKHKDNQEQAWHFCRYFSNLSKRDGIKSEPSQPIVTAIKTTFELIKEFQDITELLDMVEVSTTILPVEAKIKLTLFKKPPMHKDRKELEQLCWHIENQSYTDGILEPLLLISQNAASLGSVNPESLDVDALEILSSRLEQAFQAPDQLRSALLCSMLGTDEMENLAEGWSRGYRRYYLAYRIEKWREYYKRGHLNKVLKFLFEGVSLNDVIKSELEKESDDILRKAKEKLLGHCLLTDTPAGKWSDSYRFFYNESTLYIPNGTKAGINTVEIKLVDENEETVDV